MDKFDFVRALLTTVNDDPAKSLRHRILLVFSFYFKILIAQAFL